MESQTPDLFDEAPNRLRRRPDKEWRIAYCASFLVMERLGIWQALTGDRHFEPAGFFAILRQACCTRQVVLTATCLPEYIHL